MASGTIFTIEQPKDGAMYVVRFTQGCSVEALEVVGQLVADRVIDAWEAALLRRRILAHIQEVLCCRRAPLPFLRAS
jgi:hypothetical protein